MVGFFKLSPPCSHFIQTVLPNLKSSLSLALQHFFPLAGNLVLPPPPQMPYIRIGHGDSVRFIAKESTTDFGHLTGDLARHGEEFQALLPKLKNMQKLKPLMAIQATVFPGTGIALGVTFNHVVADGRTFIHFAQSYTLLNTSLKISCQQVSFTRLQQGFDPNTSQTTLKINC
ncbi:hypothetical protein GQ457_14G022960 [Hibiscus cannabinus]